MKLIEDVPKKKVNAYERPQVAPIEDFLKARVMGQDHAMQTVSKEVTHVLSGLKIAQDGPRGSILMLGPSGVGKTATALAAVELLLSKSKVPEKLRNPNDFLLKINCGEYGDAAALWTLTGARPGHVGSRGSASAGHGPYRPPALSTETLRKSTFELEDGQEICVVLLDEIERAHEIVRDFLLSALSEGYGKTGESETLDFRKVLFLFTSNIGNKEIREVKSALPAGTKKLPNGQADTIRRTALERTFRSEDIGRMCGSVAQAVVYEPLSAEVLEMILGKEFTSIENDFKREGITVEFHLTIAAKDALLQGGVSDDHGARSLKQYIRSKVVQPLMHPSRAENVAALNDRIIYVSFPPETQEYVFEWADPRGFWDKLMSE